MPDHHPRYVVREQYGTTVGDRNHTLDFLILDSWYCWREVLHVKPDPTNAATRPAPLRRRVYEYAAHLNDPPLCGCGCGTEVLSPTLPTHGGKKFGAYVDEKHARRARYQRDKASRGRVA